jgi:deoxyribose-phosphate aldolase
MTPADIAKLIDHTLLKPTATEADIRAVCDEARRYHFASVCVNSCFVPLVARELRESGVKVCTVVGFPLGTMATKSKAMETRQAIADGAEEIDMVLHVGHLIAGDHDYVREDIRAVVDAAQGRPVKVILETVLLSDAQKETACRLAVEAGAAFVKTCTGFAGGGATVADIALMRRIVGPNIGVKASGGIRDAAGAVALVEAGATRLGASAGVAIVEGLKVEGGY